MLHEIHSVKSIRKIAPYTLEIIFEDSSSKIINFLPVLKGEMYGPLRNEEYFDKVKIDPEVRTIFWPNGADYDPAVLYNWEHFVDELKRRSKDWELRTT
ncbi:MAG: DUF2442 domain-containing protein [Bacteroidota bacterium]|nr:DUF2442 domain-containing protein [Bacteroidota bacterium]MDQ6889381.1 DUF2442 domain-containing protein [Bacteroidota bacterium]